MFCPKCGTGNPEGANLCSRCSCVLSSAETMVSATKPRTSGLAIASMVLGILSFCTFLLTAPLAIIFGIISLVLISKSKGQLKGIGMAITGIAVPVVAVPFVLIIMAIMMPAFAEGRFAAQKVMCMNNLKQLGVATMMYAENNKDQYPATDKWCDLLKPYYKNDNLLICPSAKQVKCSYAINKNLPNNINQVQKPDETVLLFESKPGWNQAGGQELLTTENHRGRGCNVVFCDGHAEFVQAEDIGKLKWTSGP